MPPLYDQLFEMTLQVCDRFPAFTPISIREEDAEEVINMFARFVTLARRKEAEKSGGEYTPRSKTREVTGRTGQRYIIHSYEDDSGLSFGG